MREIKVCNCAGCGKELESTFVDGARDKTEVAGRINDRPYCTYCLDSHRPPTLAENLTPRQAEKLGEVS